MSLLWLRYKFCFANKLFYNIFLGKLKKSCCVIILNNAVLKVQFHIKKNSSETTSCLCETAFWGVCSLVYAGGRWWGRRGGGTQIYPPKYKLFLGSFQNYINGKLQLDVFKNLAIIILRVFLGGGAYGERGGG